jgi:hypothetical protein
MSLERAIEETIARCVSIMVAYYNSGPNERATREMVAEIRAVADAAKAFSLGIRETVDRIVRPVEAEIFVRYGHELGSRLNSQFVIAFERWGEPEQHDSETRIEVPPTGRAKSHGRSDHSHSRRLARDP